MSETLEGIAPIIGTATAPIVPDLIGSGAAAAPQEDPAPDPVETETKEKKPTEYIVLISNAEEGPFALVGTFAGFGQNAAKKAAGEKLLLDGTEGVAELFFTAIPLTSWSPEKPTGVKVQPQVTF